MAAWERQQHEDLKELNNGQQFDTSTLLTYEMFNKIVHEVIYQRERYLGHIPTSILSGGDSNGNLAN